jgi:CRISPR-associated endonuclease/helicase Cas3
MTYAEILEKCFGFQPYAYQLRVAEALLEGKNVICRSPTGSGKTEAALAPFIIARAANHPNFPLKAIIASPMKTLAKSIQARVKNMGQNFTEEINPELELDVRLHTGEDQGAPKLEGDIVVTTIDQLMSNYAHIPLSMSNGQANIGAGAVISSYIVFDEFHLLDPKRAFRTALLMIEELKDIAPFLLMTATLSSEMVLELEKICQAIVIEPTVDELNAMPSQLKTRVFKRENVVLSAEAVIKVHHRRSLAICNTVARAQNLFAELKARNLKDVRLELIHSQFFPQDRAAKEKQLEAWMGKGSNENIILVATQAIEVGINISSENLHTELCPANSLLQRAGRCARFEHEIGMVHVYDLPSDGRGGKRIMPYKEQKKELETTWAALLEVHEKSVDYSKEAELINTVHSSRDLENLQFSQEAGKLETESWLRQAREGDRSQSGNLIRSITSQSILIHSQPNIEYRTRHDVFNHQMVNFFAYPSRYKDILVHLVDENGEIDDDSDWVAKIPKDRGNEEIEIATLEWTTCWNEDLLIAQPLIVLNPNRVSYSSDLGLRLQKPNEQEKKVCSPTKEKKHKPLYPYLFETYREHIELVRDALEKKKNAFEVIHVCPKINAKFNLPQGTLEHVIWVAIAAHDIGKLATGWQDWTRAWQNLQLERYPIFLWDGVRGKISVTPQPKRIFCAHTDSHPNTRKYPKIDDETRAKQIKIKRPGHAGESAWVLYQVYAKKLVERVGNKKSGTHIFTGLYWAIARHHGARQKGETSSWKLDVGAAQEIATVFRDISGEELDRTLLQKLENQGISAAQPEQFPLSPDQKRPLIWITYSLVSRALRLADTNSFDRSSLEGEV